MTTKKGPEKEAISSSVSRTQTAVHLTKPGARANVRVQQEGVGKTSVIFEVFQGFQKSLLKTSWVKES